MNVLATVVLLAAIGVAGADWLAVAHGNKRVEYVCKPATIVLLVACATPCPSDQ